MSKKHIFLSIFSKIAIFACVFCTLSALADTTTCDIDYTPVTGNSIQNGTPTPTTPVAIESIGTKVGNKYAVQVAVNYDGGVVDLGTLNWTKFSDKGGYFATTLLNNVTDAMWCEKYETIKAIMYSTKDKHIDNAGYHFGKELNVFDSAYYNMSVAEFKSAMSGVMLYYQRETDETWTAPTLKTVYLDEPLRKVGDYADVLDYKKGQIIRNVGVLVFDGTENWLNDGAWFYYTGLTINNVPEGQLDIVKSTHFVGGRKTVDTSTMSKSGSSWFEIRASAIGAQTASQVKAWFASQYAVGTPVIVYYPLATPVVEQIENWSCILPITDIKIATTKMVDDEFAQAEANLAATVQTIESVVSRTITQTGQIQVLQDTKQTRPDESCPANMKCLLVQDEDGTPHWYPIIEP